MKKIFTLLSLAIIYAISSSGQAKIAAEDAYKHYGETVTICDKIYGVEVDGKFKTKRAINLGNPSPRKRVSILVTFDALQKLTDNGKTSIINKSVCVTGKVVEYQGHTELVVANKEEIFLLKEPGGTTEIKPNDFMKFE